MAQAVKLQASKRTHTANQVRQHKAVPAVLYGHGIDNEAIQVDARAFDLAFVQAGYTTLIDLDVDGKAHNVLIREVQLHPLKEHAVHVDFYQVRMDEVVRADVPLRFIGESSAVKDLGGIFVRNVDSVEVEALPKDLPRDIEVDITALAAIDQALHIKDLKVPAGVTIVDRDSDDVVALVQAPRSEEELSQLETEVKEDVAAVEKAGEKKVDEEEAAAEGETSATEKTAE